MPVPSLTNADLAKAFLDNLPTGLAWNKAPDSNMTAIVNALTPNLARAAQSAEALIADAFPATTEDLLPEWESSLGLPDPCQGESPTVQARQAQVVARFAGSFPIGSLSIPSIVNYAANLGFIITITENIPFFVGLMEVGNSVVAGDEHAYDITVNAPLYTSHLFEVGVDGVGEDLGSYGNAVLECEIRRILPAFARVVFAYS